MKVNGRDIAEFGARQHTVRPAFPAVTNGSEWPGGAASPLMLPSEAGMKKVEVSVILEGTDRQGIWQNAGALVAALMAPSEIELDGFSHSFHMALANATQAELSLQRFHKATLELIGYEHGPEASRSYEVSGYSSISFLNGGTMEAPAILEITPRIGRASVTVSGIVRDRMTLEDRPLTVSRLTQGRKVIVDGEKGLVTEEGGEGEAPANKFGDVSLWGFPSLLPGWNWVNVDQGGLLVTVRHKPRYL